MNNKFETFYYDNGQVSSWQSHIVIMDAQKNELMTKIIEVNAPLKYGGWTIYQASFDPDQPNWTGLLVVRDKGTPIIYAGFGLLFLGIAFHFYLKLYLSYVHQKGIKQ